MTVRPAPKLSYTEYLDREARSTEKHDFINGVVAATAGGSIEHGAVAIGIAGELRNALGSKPCRVFSSDVRVKVESTGATFYPDLSVVCGKLQTPVDDEHAIANPVVIVEVLSEGTEAYDRGAKAFHYRRLQSLREYVLVSQTDHRIELQRLNDRGVWELHFFSDGELVEFTSVGVSFPLDSVYAKPLPR